MLGFSYPKRVDDARAHAKLMEKVDRVRRVITISIPDELLRKVDLARGYMKRSDFICLILAKALAEEEKEGKVNTGNEGQNPSSEQGVINIINKVNKPEKIETQPSLNIGEMPKQGEQLVERKVDINKNIAKIKLFSSDFLINMYKHVEEEMRQIIIQILKERLNNPHTSVSDRDMIKKFLEDVETHNG